MNAASEADKYLEDIEQREPVSSCYRRRAGATAEESPELVRRIIRANPQGLEASLLTGRASSDPSGRQHQELLCRLTG